MSWTSAQVRSRVATAVRSMWGEAQAIRQIVPGVWETETAGHGGYIVAVGEGPGTFDLDPTLRISRFEAISYGRDTLRFYAFEEDCDWAVLLLAHPALREAVGRQRAKGNPSAREYYDDPGYARSVVARWNPEFLGVEPPQ